MKNESPAWNAEAGAPQALAEKCSTCVFRPGNPMNLGPGRLAEVVKTNVREGAVLTCHQTLSYGSHPEVGQAACRGFLDSFPGTQAARVVERLCGGWHLIDPPAGA